MLSVNPLHVSRAACPVFSISPYRRDMALSGQDFDFDEVASGRSNRLE